MKEIIWSISIQRAWAAKRILVRMEGQIEYVENIYHRYFIQFSSTGG